MYSQKEHFHDFKTLIMINTNNPMLLKLINDHKLQQSEKNENTTGWVVQQLRQFNKDIIAQNST